MNENSSKRYLSEAFGTFALVLLGTGSVAMREIAPEKMGTSMIALAFGLTLFFLVWIFENVSGAHFNPAVTLAAWRSGKFSGNQVLPYIVSQCSGAFSASLALKIIFPTSVWLGTTLPSGSVFQSLILEFFLTFVLMFAILNLPQKSRMKGLWAGFVVGLTVGTFALLAGPISGASMNPARSLAPAVVSGHLSGLWIYLAGPTLGAMVATFACKGLRGKSCCPSTAC